MNRVEQQSRIDEVALEHHKKLIDDQVEMAQKMASSLDDTFPKLMARDQDVDKEFQSMERRLNRHRVALDKAEEKIQTLVDAIALQQAQIDSMWDKLCHCQTRSVRSRFPLLLRGLVNGIASRS